jgi:transposase
MSRLVTVRSGCRHVATQNQLGDRVGHGLRGDANCDAADGLKLTRFRRHQNIESTMAKTRPPYTPEFRRQMVELVCAGRSPEELAWEFEPTAQSIKNCVGQAERDAGRGDALTTPEREALNRLRRENRQLS